MSQTQCDRLEAELKKGRKLTQRQIFDELFIGNHTGRISELRPKLAKEGLKIKTEWLDTAQGKTGLYSLERTLDLTYQQAENPIGKGDSWEG